MLSLSNLRRLKHRIRNHRDTNNLKGALVKLNRLKNPSKGSERN
jgi:hypothetical protein